jgi:hypothetical protein
MFLCQIGRLEQAEPTLELKHLFMVASKLEKTRGEIASANSIHTALWGRPAPALQTEDLQNHTLAIELRFTSLVGRAKEQTVEALCQGMPLLVCQGPVWSGPLAACLPPVLPAPCLHQAHILRDQTPGVGCFRTSTAGQLQLMLRDAF